MTQEKEKQQDEKKELTLSDKFKKNLEHIIRASFAAIWIRTYEEDRAIRLVDQVIKKLEGQSDLLHVWDSGGEIVQFLDDEFSGTPLRSKVESPDDLFTKFASKSFKEKSALVVLDYQFFMDNVLAIRKLKNSLSVLKRDGKMIVFMGPRLPLLEEIEKDISVIELPLPGREELKKILDFIVESAKKETGSSPSEEIKDKLIDAALGLTSQEAEDAFSLAIVKNVKLNGDSIKTVLDQKVQILRKEGILEYIEVEETMDDIGGLDSLKNFLVQRKTAFGKEARDFGLPAPKGILLVGISGCGKSLCAKAAASNWQIGIYRLDVGKIFQKLMGVSEENARKVIAIAETVSPCILWIDEIEKGMAGVRSSGELDSGVTARVTGTLLTWMQEKKSPVFIVATANDVTKLPPELLRKGRFDEVFFVDLPNDEERFEITKIQLRKRAAQAKKEFRKLFEISDSEIRKVVDASKKYTGAEIEAAAIAASYSIFEEGKRPITSSDIIKALQASVPLSDTLPEEIDSLRKWGRERARNASGKVVDFLKAGRSDTFLRKLAPEKKEETPEKKEE